ncbi:zinc finger SWIM domain-containing protein [Methanocaldococcus villosus KIN24-T80]|uniref:Zinc finger SWIM domain-containing protein n=1 Tax=Methanocaldococcus villosus KIN24-T80 TaxID=1069083 RepID=N6V3D8_9EURY|nr:SWIM zinc finger family protein [Methanocaldococcus villosus]ENN96778.1 zinc finger SWIM domain-containing protein [Methanocaldococcus villosus KIN24-T80]
MYDERIKERGKNYYINGLVKYCIKLGNKLYGKVVGSDIYNVEVDLKTLEGVCSCPYRYNCKHAYALILAYKNNDYVDGDSLFNELKKRDKEEIINILKNIVVNNYLWETFLEKESLGDKALKLIKLINYDKKAIYTFLSFLRNNVKNLSNKELLKIIKAMLDYDIYYYEEHYLEALELIINEILKRDDEDTIEELLKLYNKHKNELWLIEELLFY